MCLSCTALCQRRMRSTGVPSRRWTNCCSDWRNRAGWARTRSDSTGPSALARTLNWETQWFLTWSSSSKRRVHPQSLIHFRNLYITRYCSLCTYTMYWTMTVNYFFPEAAASSICSTIISTNSELDSLIAATDRQLLTKPFSTWHGNLLHRFFYYRNLFWKENQSQ